MVAYPSAIPLWITSLLVSAAVSSGALAQSYPAKPVRIVVAFQPGGSDDFHARLIAQKVTEIVGQQFIVENRAGGEGTIGRMAVAKAPADGYTLLLGGRTLMSIPFLFTNAGFDPRRDFVGVAPIAKVQFMMVVHPSVPARNVKEFIALARARPGELNMGSAGLASGPFLAGLLFNTMAAIKTTHIPYKGIGALNDLLAGRLDYYIASLAGAHSHVTGGRLRALGVVTSTRSKMLPDVPTIAEAGLPGYEFDLWVFIAAPAATPRAIVDVLNSAITRSVASPDVGERLLKVGSEPWSSTPDDLQRRMLDAAERTGRMLQAAGIKPQ
jgi:tripartite-type tricarboxylate transporter receptor subunit TctC